MVQVPKLQRTVGERPILQTSLTVRATADDMGAAVGRGMEALGQGVQQAGEAIKQVGVWEDQALSTTQETALADWDREAKYGDNGFMLQSGAAAVAGKENYLKKLKEMQRQFGADLRPSARAIYQQQTNQRVQSSLEQATMHAGAERKSMITEAATARVAMAKDDALAAWETPAKVEQSLQAGLAELSQRGAMEGWAPDRLKLEQQKFTSDIHSGVILRMAENDPIAAAEELFVRSDQMTADDAYLLAGKLLPLVGDAAGREAQAIPGNSPTVAPGTSVADVVRGFEGYSSTAYNDPQTDDFGRQRSANIYRAGYGSDTITRADGSRVRVTKGMVVTRDDAERDLERRLGEFQVGIVGKIGEQAWGNMDQSTQAALTSVAYNYGSLPQSVVIAIATGDRNAIAAAVESLSDHNGGVNADRRHKEAALIRNGTGAGVQFSPRVENLLAVMPADQAVQVREAATAKMAHDNALIAAQTKAAYEAHKGTVELGIVTGDIGSEQEIRSDPTLNDGDKATLLRSYRTETEASAGSRNYLSALADGTAPTLNAYSTTDQALADKSFKTVMAAVPAEQRVTAVTAFVTETQMIPKEVVAGVRQGLASTSGKDVAASMQYAAMLFDKAPIAFGAVENAGDLRDAAATYAELVGNQGLSVEQAAQRVIDMRKPENLAKSETLKTIWDQAVKSNQFTVNDVLSAFGDNAMPGGPIGGVTPYQEAAMTADYLTAAERALKGSANGDVSIAKAMALAEMHKTYGLTHVSGAEVVTKFPPENFYPPINGSQDYIRDLALSDARHSVPDAANVMLIPSAETAADVRAGRPPRYNLMIMHPNGVWDTTPSLFMVDEATLTGLSSLDHEERQTKFEMGRLYDEALRARQNDALLSGMETTPLLAGMKPKPADIVPHYDEYQARLADIELRRRNALGQNAPSAAIIPAPQQAAPQGSNADAEAAFLEQRAAAFGPLGGSN